MRAAVTDLGSNSFRLVVFTADERAGWWKRTDEIHESVRVGEGLAASGALQDEPMERALATLDVFAAFCRASGLSGADVDVVATSAIRDASNQRKFLARAHKRTGLEIRVLGKAEEARYGYLAAVNSTTLADGCVLDLGGGSMQLTKVLSRHPGDAASWPLGAVRTTEQFLPGKGPHGRKQLDKLRSHVAAELRSAPWLASSGDRLVGVGGTVRNLAAAAIKRTGVQDLGVQGWVIGRSELDALVDELAGRTVAERRKVPGIKDPRADLVLAGAVVIQTVLQEGGFGALEATEAGLREGVWFERLLGREGSSEPPLFDDVRRQSVLNLAAQFEVDPAHTEHVARLALALFDELGQAGLHPGDPLERELLWAACVLHDIGMKVDYDDHHKHSRYLILNAGLPGFSPAELVLIAQAARYHRKGTPDAGPLAPVLAGKRDLQRLDRMAVLLRLAEDLERSRDQLVREVHASTDDREVRLELVAEGEHALPRWAASRESDLFDRAFGRGLVVV